MKFNGLPVIFVKNLDTPAGAKIHADVVRLVCSNKTLLITGLEISSSDLDVDVPLDPAVAEDHGATDGGGEDAPPP